jgi:hypothetical protein
MPYKQNLKNTNKLRHNASCNYSGNSNSTRNFTVGETVSSHFWYGEPLTWIIKIFDDDYVLLDCVEYEIPTQAAHYSTLSMI